MPDSTISTLVLRKKELFIKDILESTISLSITLNISSCLIVGSRMYANIVDSSTYQYIIDSRIDPDIVDLRIDLDIINSTMDSNIVDLRMNPHIVNSRITSENLS